MIKKLFSQRLLLLVVLLSGFWSVSLAQPIVLQTTTAVATQPLYGNAAPFAGVPPDFITFSVVNDNPCPIAVTNISMFHAGSFPWPTGTPTYTISNNDSSYDLYTSLTNITGIPVSITPANGWNYVGNSGPINTGTANGITPIFNGLNLYIPANATMRFVVRAKDSMLFHFNGPSTSQSSAGVTLVSGGAAGISHFGGWFPDFYFTVGTPTPSLHFVGAITAVQLPPTPPVADNSLKPAIKCLDQMVTLKATHPKPGGTFTWRDKNGNVIAQNSTGTHQLGPLTHAHAGRYYVSYNLCGKESLADSATIIISDPPAPTISGKLDYCLNEQFEYTVVNGTNPIWYYTATGGSPVPVIPTINTSSPNTLVYYVSQTDQYGCESRERTLVRYRAAPKPEKPVVNTPLYYCEEMPADPLTAIGDTLRWYYFANGGVPTIDPPVPNTSKDDSFQYYVTQTIDGCESDRARIDVVVTFRPNGQIRLLHPDIPEICATDSVVIGYYGSAFVGSQYNWKLPERGAVILNGGFDQGPISMRLDTPGLHRITLKVGHSGCLSEEYELPIKVNELPFGTIITEHDVCLGQPELIEMVRYTPELDTFMWDFDGGEKTHFTTEQGPYGVYWATEGEKMIRATLVHEGCSATIIDSITVHPKPNAEIIATHDVFDAEQNRFIINDYMEGDEICAADSLKVTVQTVEPGAIYRWTPNRFFDNYSDRPVTYARVDFSSKIYVEVEDVYGCQNKDSLEVTTKPCCEMVFPNAFSPNSDGRNDLFRPVTIGRREVKTFQVFNRYGQLVYESKQGHRGWDGTMNGRNADIGTYFYMIQFVCGNENLTQSGEVILVR